MILAIVGGTVQSGAFIAQKKGHNNVNELNKDKPKEEHKSILTQWIWWVGFIVYTGGGAMGAIALNFAAQSIISPLSALNLATIAVLSYFILKEPLSIKDMIAVLIIIIGIVIVVIFGPSGDDNVDITIDQLRFYFRQAPYIIAVSIYTGISIFTYIGVKYAESKNFKSEENNKITYGSNFLLFGYVWLSCFFASNNTLFIKSSVSIIIGSLVSLDDLKTNATDFLSYVIITLWVACMILMEYFRQKALSHFGALYVIPIFAVMSIIMSAVIGMIYFEEYNQFTVTSGILFAVGIIITVIGVLVLSFDVGAIISDIYDDVIKVAFVDYQKNDYKYPKTVVYGGGLSEYYANYFLKKPNICYNQEFDFMQMEQRNADQDQDKPLNNNNDK